MLLKEACKVSLFTFVKPHQFNSLSCTNLSCAAQHSQYIVNTSTRHCFNINIVYATLNNLFTSQNPQTGIHFNDQGVDNYCTCMRHIIIQDILQAHTSHIIQPKTPRNFCPKFSLSMTIVFTIVTCIWHVISKLKPLKIAHEFVGYSYKHCHMLTFDEYKMTQKCSNPTQHFLFVILLESICSIIQTYYKVPIIIPNNICIVQFVIIIVKAHTTSMQRINFESQCKLFFD